MNYIIRPLELEDEPFLWEILYQAIHVLEGQTPLPREIIQTPELARYVQSWGREGDCGFLGSNALTSQPIGAVWLCLPIGEHKAYLRLSGENRLFRWASPQIIQPCGLTNVLGLRL